MDALNVARQAQRAETAMKAEAIAVDRQLKQRELRQSYWRTVLQSAGAVALLAGLAFTWIEMADSRETTQQQLGFTARQLEAVESGQITERFSRAIDQLGDDAAVEVRVGGIYGLERIAHDSERDRQTVAEVLSSFVVRVTAAEPRVDELGLLEYQAPPDVRAAATVLGRMYLSGEPTAYDLNGAKLHTANLKNANLRGASLASADLRLAKLDSADLREAVLDDADLRNADLRSANLRNASLGLAHLENADLTNADLRGAQLDTTGLDNTFLEGACINAQTSLPDGFDPSERGVREDC